MSLPTPHHTPPALQPHPRASLGASHADANSRPNPDVRPFRPPCALFGLTRVSSRIIRASDGAPAQLGCCAAVRAGRIGDRSGPRLGSPPGRSTMPSRRGFHQSRRAGESLLIGDRTQTGNGEDLQRSVRCVSIRAPWQASQRPRRPTTRSPRPQAADIPLRVRCLSLAIRLPRWMPTPGGGVVHIANF